MSQSKPKIRLTRKGLVIIFGFYLVGMSIVLIGALGYNRNVEYFIIGIIISVIDLPIILPMVKKNPTGWNGLTKEKLS